MSRARLPDAGRAGGIFDVEEIGTFQLENHKSVDLGTYVVKDYTL